MKLRIRGNSLRLRLGRSEVRRLLDDGVVEESTSFDPAGNQRLVYAIRAVADRGGISASFDAGTISLAVPTEMIESWGGGDAVGMQAEQPIGAGATLSILIEKDFECIDAPARESQEDAFPHPLRETGCAPNR